MEEKLKPFGDLLLNESMRKHTTFKIGGNAKYFIYPKNEISLQKIIQICKDEKVDYKVIGKGSNLLFSDDEYDGVVICLDRYFHDFEFDEDGFCYAQAGLSVIFLASEAMKQGLSGLEFASGIPATIGGATFMNAGAYKSDMSKIINRVYVLKNDSCIWMNKDDLDFNYRHSLFQKHPELIILGVELQLEKGDQKDIKELMNARRIRRFDSQPLDKPSAGSMFRNPEEAPAWKLIEDCGLRGKCIGGAKISEKHANFIVNEDNAKASDVIDLVNLVKKTVYDKYHIDLKTEVEKFNWKDSKKI